MATRRGSANCRACPGPSFCREGAGAPFLPCQRGRVSAPPPPLPPGSHNGAGLGSQPPLVPLMPPGASLPGPPPQPPVPSAVGRAARPGPGCRAGSPYRGRRWPGALPPRSLGGQTAPGARRRPCGGHSAQGAPTWRCRAGLAGWQAGALPSSPSTARRGLPAARKLRPSAQPAKPPQALRVGREAVPACDGGQQAAQGPRGALGCQLAAARGHSGGDRHSPEGGAAVGQRDGPPRVVVSTEAGLCLTLVEPVHLLLETGEGERRRGPRAGGDNQWLHVPPLQLKGSHCGQPVRHPPSGVGHNLPLCLQAPLRPDPGCGKAPVVTPPKKTTPHAPCSRQACASPLGLPLA